MIILDYVWYRIALVYYKWDSDGITASGFLAIAEGILLLNIAKEVLGNTLPFGGNPESYVGLVLAIFAFNYFHYKNKYWRLRDRWMKEPKGLTYILKGAGVIAFLAVPWIWFFMTVQFEK